MTGHPGCGCGNASLGPPTAGRGIPNRQLGTLAAFRDALVTAVEQTRTRPGGPVIGRRWDLAGDPAGYRLADLWGYVADGVASYSALTAGESYLPTALDWTDLQRIAALTGFRPQPRVAARGWIRVDVDPGASPMLPAGTRVQAPATPSREAQTFEVVTDTPLRADWAELTATAVPQPAAPTDRRLRFLLDPGFRPGDRVLLVAEQGVPAFTGSMTWYSYWLWLLVLNSLGMLFAPQNRPVAVAVVTERTDDLGTVVVTFDRDLSALLPGTTIPYAAYRIVASAGSARRVTQVVRVPPGGTVDAPSIASLYGTHSALSSTHVVLDTALDDLSAQRQVALVDWSSPVPGCDIATVGTHRIVEWPVVPGTTARASRLEFASAVAVLGGAAIGSRPVTAYVVDRRVAARTYVIPDTITAPAGGRPQVRIYPAPASVPGQNLHRIALRVGPAESDWQVLRCAEAESGTQEADQTSGPDVPRGVVLDLLDPAPAAALGRAPATANLAPVRHGGAASQVLGSGAATRPSQAMVLAKAPIAYDVADDGRVVSSLEIRVDGVLWTELPTLSGAGQVDAYSTEPTEAGGLVVRFGDGVDGNLLPTGRGNVSARFRVGGGAVGELPAGAIDTLLGTVAGVVGVRGAGPTVGGADGDDQRRIARLAPTRSRALGRVVSRQDLADIALSFPGVSHATAWRGAGPPGHSCGGSGEHVAFLRLDGSGRPRPPVVSEIADLKAYLDAHRDSTVALCVAAAVVTELGLTATVAIDPRYLPTDVLAGVRAALAAVDGPLDPRERRLGEPLDRSDVVSVVHVVDGVVGLPILRLSDPRPGGPSPTTEVGRVAAERYRLLMLAAVPALAAEVS